MNRQYWRSLEDPMAIVRTRCRVCGKGSLVTLPAVYSKAVDAAHWIDDQVMEHEDHTEAGGWGLHLCLDAVLRAVFPSIHLEELFPMPSWYPHHAHRDGPNIEVLRILKKNGVDRIL
jgi:hypothetical protein